MRGVARATGMMGIGKLTGEPVVELGSYRVPFLFAINLLMPAMSPLTQCNGECTMSS